LLEKLFQECIFQDLGKIYIHYVSLQLHLMML